MLLASTLSWLMLLGGVVLLLVVLARVGRKIVRRGQVDAWRATRERDQLSEQAQRRRPLADASADLARWEVEMHETARDLQAQLDTRLSMLQTLVGLADQAADRLERLLDRAEQQHAPPTKSDAEAAPSSDEPLPEEVRQAYDLADGGETAAKIAERLGRTLGDVELLLSLREPAGRRRHADQAANPGAISHADG